MLLILLYYLLMASTFTFAKTAVFYMKPIFFIGIRMTIAGAFLLSYIHFFKKKTIIFTVKDIKLFSLIIIFHIYCAYIFEFVALQYLTSSKVALLYNLSPFITGLLYYICYAQQLSYSKWIAMAMGFVSMLPVLFYASNTELLFSFSSFSFAELLLLFAIGSAAFGWLIMKELVIERHYNTFFVNGIGMFFGGVAALITALFFEGTQPFLWDKTPVDTVGKLLIPYLNNTTLVLLMTSICMGILIILSNLIAYNLYGYLLRHYTPTFLSFAGFITPFFASIFGWFFLSERLNVPFFISLMGTIISLYYYYKQEE